MSFKCSCSHLRLDHDGGKKAINDRRVGNCNIQGCNCQEYNADKESRQQKTDLILSSLTITFILAGVCVGGFVVTVVAIDFMLKDFIITSEIEYKKFQNGEEVEFTNIGDIPIEPKEIISYSMKMITGFIFLSVALFGGIFSFDTIYSSKLKQLREIQ